MVERQQGAARDTFLLLEHPPVITLGRNARRKNLRHPEALLRARGIAVAETGRGGDVTYHGPGQVVGYPLIRLGPDRRDVRRYVHDLEEVLIRTAAAYGVQAGRVQGLPGVWTGGEKLAAIGVRISRWVTSHGFAFNVSTELSAFDLIVPCGIPACRVTSLRRILGREIPLDQVARRLAERFGEVFDFEMIRSPPEALLGTREGPGSRKESA